MTTTRVLAKSGSDSTLEGMYGMALFLTNELVGSTGSSWTLVEADDTANRDTAASFGALPSNNKWNTSNLDFPITGSWCVLESDDANNTNHFQLFIKLEEKNEVQFRMFPFEDFATGGSTTAGSDPTMPARAVGASTSSNVTLTGFHEHAVYSCIADEGMAAMIFDSGAEFDAEWFFAGELNPFHSQDERCYVIHDSPSVFYWAHEASLQENFNRISPLDDTEALVRGEPFHWAAGFNGAAPRSDDVRGNISSDPIFTVGLMFEDVDHIHHVGWFRNIFGVNRSLGSEGVLGPSGSADFYFRGSDIMPARVPADRWAICFVWDGTTFV